MRFSKYFLLLISLFSIHAGFSQTALVTSTADNGSGTLRAALLEIPLIRTTPYIIHFNLPGAAPGNDGDRTIRLRSPLPVIPSNVIIDGSTQNWPALGVSGAKIIIEPENPGSTFSGLVIGPYVNGVETTGVEIYGLYLRNFAAIPSLQNVNTAQGSGIIIGYANGIKIGAPGKGNVISGNINGISIQNSNYYGTATAAITIQSNLIGVFYDGVTPNSNLTGISATLYNAPLNIGGDNVNEGNVISANQTNIDINRYDYNNTATSINIINNNIGTDISGKKAFSEISLFTSAPSTSEFYGVKLNSPHTNLYMRNNTISGNRTWGISIANADFVLTGNAIGTDKQGIENLGNGGGIRIETGATGTIGGTTLVDPNLIAYNTYGIESASERSVKITRNSMFCNTIFGIGKSLIPPQAYVQILKQSANHVSGRATPNSDVELFYAINCGGTCEGKTYFKTVIAGSDGRWEADVPLNDHVVATASLLNTTTSEFSSTALLVNEAIVEPVTCNGNGSISIPEPREGFTFIWNSINSDGTHILIKNGLDQEITNLEVGSYEVIIDDGCKAIAQQFEIKDQKLTEIVPVAPQPACGQTTFSFGASVQRGKGTIHFQWKDGDGNIVATSNGNISNVSLPEGTYSVTATDDAGCSRSYNFPEIKRKPQPIIQITQTPTAAACGQSNGSITGVVITDATNPKYKWYTYTYNQTTGTGIRGTTPISEEPDLTNVYSGFYQLEVSDDGGCPSVSSSPIFVGVYESVIIYLPSSTKSATCGQNNGSITGITIGEADTYELFGPAGTSLSGSLPYAVGNALTFNNLASGNYRLHALNSVTGCNGDKSFVINRIDPPTYDYSANPLATTCGQDNGSITIRFANNSPFPKSYSWKDASGQPVTGAVKTDVTTILLPNLAGGTYSMTAYDANGCDQTFGPYTIGITPILTVEPNTGMVTNDGCSLLRGAINGIQVNGGIPPYNFTWENEAGQVIKSNQPIADLSGIPEGKYRMILKDNTSCGMATSEYYTVENPSFPISTPVVNDMRVCYATEIMLQVMAPEEGTYQLYNEVTDATPTLESTNKGIFVFKVSKTGDYKIRRRLGTCYSEFTTVHIEVTNDNLRVMNTITPNNDGMNDTWIINGLPDYGNINIKLYTRSGQLVYESLGKYNKPFDGHFRGKELPAGVYYYRIDLRADCKPLGGSLTLLR